MSYKSLHRIVSLGEIFKYSTLQYRYINHGLLNHVNQTFTPNVSTSFVRGMAGHSKWQNIRHVKGAKDRERSLVFLKHAQNIKLSVTKGGGGDPKLNSMLANAISMAKRDNMPIAKIESQIKQITESKNDFKSSLLEIKGPRGSFIIIEIYSDKIPKFIQDLRHAIKRIPGFGISENSVKGLFTYKGQVITECETPDGKEISIDKATEDAILAGAEEVQEIEYEDGNLLEFACDPYELYNVKKNLEETGSYVISSAECSYIANSYVNLHETEVASLQKLYDKFEQWDEIVNNYSNIANPV